MKTESLKLDRLKSLKNILIHHQEQIAHLIMGQVKKPLTEARGEVAKSISAIEYVIDYGPQLNWNSILQVPARYQVQLSPIGTVLAIEPWNFPMWQLFRVLPWNYWIGNRVLHKNSFDSQKVSDYLTPLIQEALGKEFFESFYLPDSEVEDLIDTDRVQAVTLTGSTRAGRQVAARAGRALKKCVLELGGSDAFLITEGADLNLVINEAVQARTQNNGQSCIAAKRFIVHHRLYSDFILRLKNALALALDVTLVHDRALAQINAQIHLAEKCGARAHWPKGSSQLPMILECQGSEAFLRSEEFFGPVFVLIPFRTLEDSIYLANQTDYGLGASVWGAKDQEKISYAQLLAAGFISFDEQVRSHPAVPFGGIKDSGYGREMGVMGFLEFSNIKIIKNL